MQLSNREISLMVKLIAQESKRNPSPDIDELMAKMERSLEWRTTKNKLPKIKPVALKNDLVKVRKAKERREQARPVMGDASYHPLHRPPAA